jgi:hypothetical protein
VVGGRWWVQKSMTRTASRISLRGGGAVGRSTRGVALPFAQITDTGIVANVVIAADCGTSTLQVETTVAVTTRGAAADCASASPGTPDSNAAVTTIRIIPAAF